METKRNVLCEVLDLVAILEVLPPSEQPQQLELIRYSLKDYPFDNQKIESNYFTANALEFLKRKQIQSFKESIETALSHLD